MDTKKDLQNLPNDMELNLAQESDSATLDKNIDPTPLSEEDLAHVSGGLRAISSDKSPVLLKSINVAL